MNKDAIILLLLFAIGLYLVLAATNGFGLFAFGMALFLTSILGVLMKFGKWLVDI